MADQFNILDSQRPPTRPLISGRWYAVNPGTSSTSNAHVNNQAYATRADLPACTISSLAIETTVAGEVGSVYRLAIYSTDPATGLPKDLIIDAGTVATDGAPGEKAVTISQALAAGTYWFAAMPQSAATLRPTVRVAAQDMAGIGAAGSLSLRSNSSGYALAMGAGAFPAAFGTPTVTTGIPPYIAYKVA